MTVPFHASAASTLGVEWELALVDRDTRDLTNAAGEVLADLRSSPASAGLSSRATEELLRNTVEVVSGVHRTAGEAVADVAEVVDAVRAAADHHGVDVLSAGTHPFGQWSSTQLTDSPRYAELIERTRWWGRQMLIWGVHVHVGITDRAQVLPVVSSLLRYQPHLQALSASSPFWDSQDTGYASSRALLFQQLPTAGLPQQFREWSELEAYVDDQTRTGVIDRFSEIRWDVRPSPAIGTIEVRICDGIPTRHELAALTALTHCLVVDLAQRCGDGEELPVLQPWFVQENKWRAARYGLDAEIITDAAGAERHVVDDLDDLLTRLEPVAARLGCADELAAVADVPLRGASYQRQREVADSHDGDLTAVVDSLVAELGP